MKVLIATGIFPPDIGGPATHAPVIAEGLRSRGHRVTVLTMSDRPGGDRDDPFPVIRVVRHGPPPVRWIAGATTLLRAMRGADVVYALGLLPQAVAASAVMRRPLVARIVSDVAWDRAMAYGWTKDDLPTFNSRRYGLRTQLLKSVHYGAMRRAHLVVVPSRWLAAWVEQRGVSASRVRVILNALAPMSAVGPRRILVLTPYLIAAVGRMVAFKQFDVTIRAVAQMPDVSLLLVGDGPQRGALQDLAASLGLTDRVIFVGARPRDEMLSVMAGCDALVQASSYEGLPHVILEAMSLGVVVIVTAAGGTLEVVVDGQNGLVADGTVSGLQDTLRRLLGDPDLRRRLAARAREDVARHFSAAAMVDGTERVLMEAART